MKDDSNEKIQQLLKLNNQLEYSNNQKLNELNMLSKSSKSSLTVQEDLQQVSHLISSLLEENKGLKKFLFKPQICEVSQQTDDIHELIQQHVDDYLQMLDNQHLNYYLKYEAQNKSLETQIAQKSQIIVQLQLQLQSLSV